MEGRVPGDGTTFALDERIGPVDIDLEGDPRRPRFLWMRHRDATFGAEVKDRAGAAEALGLDERDLLSGAPIEPGSTGNEFLYVPLRDRTAVDRAVLDATRMESVAPDTGRIGVFVFAPDGDRDTRRVYSRMFAPAHGVAEDPATGSASGALGAYVAIHGLVAPAESMRIVSEQGTKMGHQSFVHVALRFAGGIVSDIRVGGAVAPVLEGTLTLP